MDHLKLLKVAVRMLLDVVVVMEKKEEDYEIGCKAKSSEVAESLKKLLAAALVDCPVQVIIKEETIVVITPSSCPEASLPQYQPSQTPLPPSPRGPSPQESPSLP